MRQIKTIVECPNNVKFNKGFELLLKRYGHDLFKLYPVFKAPVISYINDGKTEKYIVNSNKAWMDGVFRSTWGYRAVKALELDNGLDVDNALIFFGTIDPEYEFHDFIRLLEINFKVGLNYKLSCHGFVLKADGVEVLKLAKIAKDETVLNFATMCKQAVADFVYDRDLKRLLAEQAVEF